ncbi:MAG: metallophosphoesterase [Actinobacteria bacterium]|nr:metallophosphoesterase [Actinomycetota bacterium]
MAADPGPASPAGPAARPPAPPRRRRPTWRRLKVVLFAAVGAVLALSVAGSVQARIGPFDTTVSARPGWSGATVIRLAPLGSIVLETHDSPVVIEARVDELRLPEAERIARNPKVLDSLQDGIAADAQRALRLLALRALVALLAGGSLGAFVARARLSSVVTGAIVGLALALGVGAMTVASFDPGAIAEPRYTGLLTVAPTAVGDVEGIVDRFGEYRAQLTELVRNVVMLYRAAQGLPTFDPTDNTIRVLQVSDIHLNPQAFDLIEVLVRQFRIDAVIDTGDITDWGTEPEGRLVDRIGQLGVPYVWVRGNHDSARTQAAVAREPGAVVLDSQARTVAGLRLWGYADRRYTPSKDQPTGKEVEQRQAKAAAPQVRRELRRDEPPAVDVALVHDPALADGLAGAVPLVLAGHTHAARQRSLGSSLLLVEGSTGGAGLRALQGAQPEPLASSVLYFDRRSRRLVAYDRITVRGLGRSGVRIERNVIPPRR